MSKFTPYLIKPISLRMGDVIRVWWQTGHRAPVQHTVVFELWARNTRGGVTQYEDADGQAHVLVAANGVVSPRGAKVTLLKPASKLSDTPLEGL